MKRCRGSTELWSGKKTVVEERAKDEKDPRFPMLLAREPADPELQVEAVLRGIGLTCTG